MALGTKNRRQQTAEVCKQHLRENHQRTWTQSFRAIYEKALESYQQGNRNLSTYFTADEIEFLRSIGCKPMEVYDFVEDYPAIEWDTVLLITAVRRTYYLFVDGAPSRDYAMTAEKFPPKDAEIQGIAWLPRLIVKANAKLRGHLPKELMYCCGGDRAFFKRYDIHPADFLRLVWDAGDNHSKIVEFVKARNAGMEER